MPCHRLDDKSNHVWGTVQRLVACQQLSADKRAAMVSKKMQSEKSECLVRRGFSQERVD